MDKRKDVYAADIKHNLSTLLGFIHVPYLRTVLFL